VDDISQDCTDKSKNMILTFFLTLLYWLINLLVGILPVGHLPAIMTTSFSYMVNVANSFSYIIPIATLLQALAVVIAFDGAIVLWHFANWIIRKIPGMQ